MQLPVSTPLKKWKIIQNQTVIYFGKTACTKRMLRSTFSWQEMDRDQNKPSQSQLHPAFLSERAQY